MWNVVWQKYRMQSKIQGAQNEYLKWSTWANALGENPPQPQSKQMKVYYPVNIKWKSSFRQLQCLPWLNSVSHSCVWRGDDSIHREPLSAAPGGLAHLAPTWLLLTPHPTWPTEIRSESRRAAGPPVGGGLPVPGLFCLASRREEEHVGAGQHVSCGSRGKNTISDQSLDWRFSWLTENELTSFRIY